MTFQQWKKRGFDRVINSELNRIKKTNAEKEEISVSEYWSELTVKQKSKLRNKAKSNIDFKKWVAKKFKNLVTKEFFESLYATKNVFEIV